MGRTKIEWADFTFNPWKGCTKVSPGCLHCYAQTYDKRHLQEPVSHWGKGAPRLRASEKQWEEPRRWNRQAEREASRPRVFCASMADWLDEEAPIAWLADLLELIHETPHLDWLLLTKRPENWRVRLLQALTYIESAEGWQEGESRDGLNRFVYDWLCDEPPANVWIGTTFEDQNRANERTRHLIAIPAVVRFVSAEPLLGRLDLSPVLEVWDYCGSCGGSFEHWPDRGDVCPACGVRGCMSAGYGSHVREMYDVASGRMPVDDGPPIHWVICGGESGPGARPLHPDWVRSLRDQCQAADVPFFFKQWGEWLGLRETTWLLLGKLKGPKVPANPEFYRWSDGEYTSARVGKHAAGRLLDGVEHNAFPTPAEPQAKRKGSQTP